MTIDLLNRSLRTCDGVQFTLSPEIELKLSPLHEASVYLYNRETKKGCYIGFDMDGQFVRRCILALLSNS